MGTNVITTDDLQDLKQSTTFLSETYFRHPQSELHLAQTSSQAATLSIVGATGIRNAYLDFAVYDRFWVRRATIHVENWAGSGVSGGDVRDAVGRALDDLIRAEGTKSFISVRI